MTIIGAGNMATNLAFAFMQKGVAIRCIYSHSEAHAKELVGRLRAAFPEAESFPLATSSLRAIPLDDMVYLYAIKDSVLHEVLLEIDAPEALHLHTAGSMGMAVFEGTNKPYCGVLYPFQTLSKDRVLDFSHLPIFVEESGEVNGKAMVLAEQISDQVYRADSDTRRRLHLAGVFANNFSNCMYAIAGEMLRETGIPEQVLLSLIDETAAKVHTMPARQAQTGPAKRYDENVMEKHLSLIQDENVRTIYRAISKNIHENS